MNKLYFEELDPVDQDKVVELLYKSRRFIPDFIRTSTTESELLKKVHKLIASDNIERTKSDWLSWSTTEASKPHEFNKGP